MATYLMGDRTVMYREPWRTFAAATGARTGWVLACAGLLALAACTNIPPPPPPPQVVVPVQTLPASIVIVQPVRQEPPPLPAAPPVLEPPKVNEEAEEALAVLSDLQKLVLAGPDEQKRELAAATQALTRQRSDAIRLRLGMLQSLPAAGGDDARALTTLEPLLKQGNGPTRMVAAVLMAQMIERQRAVREEKKRVDDLQQKLDALKALERSLLGRDRKPTTAP
ncbi:MAG: hypothetical protein IPM02_15335 [Betaproteobacteria bacterium]|nr:hypothetical protein [Betaproteobacteria bacterium]